jgi:SanA protein
VPPAPHSPSFGQRLRAEFAWFNAFVTRWLVRLLVVATHLTLVMLACYVVVWGMAREHCYDSVDEIPVKYAAIVLGCPPKVGPYENAFFTARVDAAARLFSAGKVQYLVVSGDPDKNGHNEPREMKAALIAKGVPADHIYSDEAGFRTLDSVVRARKIFGQRDFTIVSQRFHNERALFLARRLVAPDSVAFDAAPAHPAAMFKSYLREIGARVMVVLDVAVLKTQPKELGDKVTVGPKSPPVDSRSVP